MPVCSGAGSKPIGVAGLACVLQADSGRLVLVAAFTNGALFSFDGNTGDALAHFKSAQHVTSLLPSARYSIGVVRVFAGLVLCLRLSLYCWCWHGAVMFL
jgi:hypothetical protein